MLFSLVIPVYNVAPYLRECLDSVLCQEFRDFEVILVDDGSTDESGRICDDYARRDSRIRVIYQENAGASAARNVGIQNTVGEYILFLDGDDSWCTDSVLDAIADRIKKTKPDVLSYNYVKVFDKKVGKPYFSCKTPEEGHGGDFAFQCENELWLACPWNKAIRRTLFEGGALNFREGITAEDMDWCLRLALAAEKFDYLDTVVVCYRQRESSVSGSTSPGKVRTVLGNIRRCLELLEENGTERAEQLKPFVAYQYGTVLYHLAKLPVSREKEDLLTQAKELRYLLRWSDNWKIRLLNLAASLGGLRCTLAMLRWK